jgi:hypothetical protein
VADLEVVLRLLKSFRGKSQVQAFLHGNDLARSGTWDALEERIERATEHGGLEIAGLVTLLEEIEEHGDQYVFLYDLVPHRQTPLPTVESIRAALTAQETRTVLDSVNVVENPGIRATLVSVRLSDRIAKFRWVQRRIFYRRLDQREQGNRLTVEYEIVPVRAVDLAVLDLQERKAYLCIQRVEEGIRECRKYLPDLRDRLSRFADQAVFNPLDLRRLMERIGDRTFVEVRRRRHQMRDDTGCVVDATSATESADVFNGALYSAARDNYQGALTDLHSNVYWLENGAELQREIHTLFPYRNFPNAVIFTQRCSQRERDYVLSRIEQTARG